jgi:hypothetical protein
VKCSAHAGGANRPNLLTSLNKLLGILPAGETKEQGTQTARSIQNIVRHTTAAHLSTRCIAVLVHQPEADGKAAMPLAYLHRYYSILRSHSTLAIKKQRLCKSTTVRLVQQSAGVAGLVEEREG